MSFVPLLPFIIVAVLIGVILQRLSGTGVGLVVAPVLTLLLGPALGVFVTNTATIVSGFLIMLAVFHEVDWKRYLIIAPAALVGAFPAAALVGHTDPAWLDIIIGVIVVIGLLLTFGVPRLPHLSSSALTGAAGIIGGFLNTTAGVAAPAMVIYSKFARWNQRSFAATMQPTFMTMGIFSVTVKLLTGTVTTAQLPPWWILPIIVATVLVGMWIGGAVAKVVTMGTARGTAVVLAGLGGVVTIVRGVFLLA
ncbi:sulfite exporter TauE/SafE family protein [Brevibacterium sp. 50QC2O2]|uniref:TSUP family transporter n=1 Tax=Brevibacterium TaxID=1696 RepID=UPI00211C0B25|nr:sulfite exporter TauE/SafE family protein [Brevibacterium sp. 91QC2O2]MCQ9385214.1 sulfite exporter TauE/SafE family protein [Brevibacterium sp. 68QC2CO]MCQ9388720.1 sulfite exporter TauE/SafE family protein [Brevibacterium sp. 50QC2O2]